MIPFVCSVVTAAALYYVFFYPGEVYAGEEKTRLGYLRERKEAVYENLRDLNFEYNAGKFPDGDYQAMKASLEEEAAAVLAWIELLVGDASSARLHAAEALEVGQMLGSPVIECLSLGRLGLAWLAGLDYDPPRARGSCENALRTAGSPGGSWKENIESGPVLSHFRK